MATDRRITKVPFYLLLAFMLAIMAACGTESTVETEDTAPATTAAAPVTEPATADEPEVAVEEPAEEPPEEPAEERVLTLRHTRPEEHMQIALDPDIDPGSPMSISLWIVDPEGVPQPMFAKSWDISGDATSYTFYLHEDWKWSDGEDVTSEDVKFTIENVLAPHNPWGTAFWANLDTIETPDPHTVVINLTAPQNLALPLSTPFGAIVPKHVYEGTDVVDNPVNRNPVVAGPYMLDEWVTGSHVILVQNPEWNGPAEAQFFDRIIFRLIKDYAAAVTALESGQIDYIHFGAPSLTPQDIDRFGNDPNFVLFSGCSPNGEQDTLLMNALKPPLEAVEVRHAIALAIDRQAMTDVVTLGNMEPAKGFIAPCGTMASLVSQDYLAGYNYDPERAAAMLDAAGYPADENGFRFSLKMTVPDEPQTVKMQDIIRDQLAEIGIEVDGNVADFNTQWARVFEWTEDDTWQGFDMTIMSSMWTAPPNIRAYYHSDRYLPGTYWSNAWGYRVPEVDSLLEQVTSTVGDEQQAAADALQERLAADLPTYPLITVKLYGTASADLKADFPIGSNLTVAPPYPPYDVSR